MGDEENLKKAIGHFEKALEFTEKEGDTAATRAIKVALADCRERLKKLQVNTPRGDKKEETTSAVKSQSPPPPSKPKEAEKPPQSPPPKANENKSKQPIDYEIHVKTSADIESGTDAKVFICLYGDSGELIDLSLKNDCKDSFERDRRDTFVLNKLTDIGKLKKIKIGHNGEEKGSSWKLEQVKVYYNNTVYTFQSNRWIDPEIKEDSDKFAMILLEPASVETNLSRYEVLVKTMDEMGAGTDANVFVTLKGDSGELPGVELNKANTADQKSNIFEQDSLDKFILFLKDIGKIQKLTVWHDGKGIGSSWKLANIKIIKDGSTTIFEANKTIEDKDKIELVAGKSNGNEKKSTVDEAQNKKPAPTRTVTNVKAAPVTVQKTQDKISSQIDYEIQVKTCDEMSAGTDSNVFISLVGEKGELTNLQLKNPDRNNLFEKNNLDFFYLDKLVDIGKLKKIKIGHDGQTKGSSWKLEFVKVFYNSNVYTFKANRWIDIENKPESEKYISIEIEPSGGVESNVKRYEVHVKTSDEAGAGTDSNIFMSLKGASGELANVELKSYVFDKNKNMFEQNQVDKFVLYMKDIGNIQKLTIWHDAKGFGSSWKLDYVKVIANGSSILFNANKWIEKSKLELTPS